MPDVRFILPEAQREKLEASLDPKQLRQAIYQIVARTTGHFTKIIQDVVRKSTTIKQKYVRRVIVARKPQGDPPEGIVTVKRERIPLEAFQVRVSKLGGVTVTISKDRDPIRISHGFRATMPGSGHVGIFTRSRHLPTRGANASARGKRGGPKYRITPKGVAGRLAIEERFGPTVLDIVSFPDTLKTITFDGEQYMQKQAESQISRFLNQQPITDETQQQ